jgi:hypothetical protein
MMASRGRDPLFHPAVSAQTLENRPERENHSIMLLTSTCGIVSENCCTVWRREKGAQFGRWAGKVKADAIAGMHHPKSLFQVTSCSTHLCNEHTDYSGQNDDTCQTATIFPGVVESTCEAEDSNSVVRGTETAQANSPIR